MVTSNRDMHLVVHDRVAIAHGKLTSAQAYADFEKPAPGQVPTQEYVDSIRLLVDAVGEYGDAVASLGAVLAWSSSTQDRGDFRR